MMVDPYSFTEIPKSTKPEANTRREVDERMLIPASSTLQQQYTYRIQSTQERHVRKKRKIAHLMPQMLVQPQPTRPYLLRRQLNQRCVEILYPQFILKPISATAREPAVFLKRAGEVPAS